MLREHSGYLYCLQKGVFLQMIQSGPRTSLQACPGFHSFAAERECGCSEYDFFMVQPLNGCADDKHFEACVHRSAYLDDGTAISHSRPPCAAGPRWSCDEKFHGTTWGSREKQEQLKAYRTNRIRRCGWNAHMLIFSRRSGVEPTASEKLLETTSRPEEISHILNVYYSRRVPFEAAHVRKYNTVRI